MAAGTLYVQALYLAICDAINAAWEVREILTAEPSLKKDPNYAVIDLPDDVDVDFDGCQVEQSYSFGITGIFAWPDDPSKVIKFEQEAKANLLIPALQPAPEFATIGYLPLVSKIVFSSDDNRQEGRYEVFLQFDCKVSVDHH